MYEKQCATVYKSVCEDQTRTVYEPYTETECSTEYKEDCEFQWQGEGHNKVSTSKRTFALKFWNHREGPF